MSHPTRRGQEKRHQLWSSQTLNYLTQNSVSSYGSYTLIHCCAIKCKFTQTGDTCGKIYRFNGLNRLKETAKFAYHKLMK
ncbi:hypothetical protein DMENIID0001_039600 [Sergentomyia squamirostris]